jgi:hypothetical protein
MTSLEKRRGEAVLHILINMTKLVICFTVCRLLDAGVKGDFPEKFEITVSRQDYESSVPVSFCSVYRKVYIISC